MVVITRTLTRKGGSLSVVIPKEISEPLGLKEGEQLVFIFDPKTKYTTIGKPEILRLKDGRLKGMMKRAFGAPTVEKLEEALKEFEEELKKMVEL